MKIAFHRNFEKRYKKASSKVCSRFDERLRIFAKNAFHPILSNLPLTGDWRAIYVFVEENEVVCYRHGYA